MSGSIFGKNFQVSTWGESHGKALGVVIDGCPAGLPLTEEDIQPDLDRRKPGVNPYATKRKESDTIEILSGVFEGKTTGTPISCIVYNKDHHSADYSQIAHCYRPGHADFTFDQKYGFRDYRGGGRSSGRETLARVASGAVAKKILKEIGISIDAYTYAIGPVTIDKEHFDLNERWNNPLVMPDADAAEKAGAYLQQCMKEEDSAGGVAECIISNLPAGLGDPVFDKLDANLGKAMFSIGAVKAVEIGSGFQSASMTGSAHNDGFTALQGKPQKLTNHAGGILGGISDGSPVIVRVAFKPTPSIHKEQQTITTQMEPINIQIQGRHDPIIVPRAIVVVEAMAAITLVDLLFSNLFARMDTIKSFYFDKK